MSLSAEEITKCFEIIGLPQSGKMTVITGFTHIPGRSLAATWSPTYTEGDCADLVAKVTTKLTTELTATQETIVKALLANWDTIGSTSPLRVESAGVSGTSGVLHDAAKERRNIRNEIGQIIGLWVPDGGFIADAQANLARFMPAGGPGAVNDRN